MLKEDTGLEVEDLSNVMVDRISSLATIIRLRSRQNERKVKKGRLEPGSPDYKSNTPGALTAKSGPDYLLEGYKINNQCLIPHAPGVKLRWSVYRRPHRVLMFSALVAPSVSFLCVNTLACQYAEVRKLCHKCRCHWSHLDRRTVQEAVMNEREILYRNMKNGIQNDGIDFETDLVVLSNHSKAGLRR